MPAGPSPDPSGGGGGGFDDGGDLSAQHAGWIVKDTASRLLGLAYNRTHTGNPQRLCVHRRQRRAERVAAKRRKEASAAREGEMVSLDEFPELEELIKADMEKEARRDAERRRLEAMRQAANEEEGGSSVEEEDVYHDYCSGRRRSMSVARVSKIKMAANRWRRAVRVRASEPDASASRSRRSSLGESKSPGNRSEGMPVKSRQSHSERHADAKLPSRLHRSASAACVLTARPSVAHRREQRVDKRGGEESGASRTRTESHHRRSVSFETGDPLQLPPLAPVEDSSGVMPSRRSSWTSSQRSSQASSQSEAISRGPRRRRDSPLGGSEYCDGVGGGARSSEGAEVSGALPALPDVMSRLPSRGALAVGTPSHVIPNIPSHRPLVKMLMSSDYESAGEGLLRAMNISPHPTTSRLLKHACTEIRKDRYYFAPPQRSSPTPRRRDSEAGGRSESMI